MTAAPSSTPFSTCDFCDEHKGDMSGSFRVLPAVFQSFGGVAAFAGSVSTVKCHEDNTQVKAAVESPGEGRVLVVDGCVRDVAELNAAAVGLRALGLMPLPTERRGEGQRDVAVQIQGVWVRPGDWLYADADGIVVSTQPLAA